MPTCCALVLSGGENLGKVCGNNVRGDGVRCGVHAPSFDRDPAFIANREIKAYVRGLLMRTERIFLQGAFDIEHYVLFVRRVRTWLTARRRVLTLHEDLIRDRSFPYGDPVPDYFTAMNNGQVIPFPPAAQGARRDPRVRPGAHPPRANRDPPPPDPRPRRARRPAPPPPDVPLNPLAAFASDRQNVHTALSVRMATQVVSRVLKIAVPEEYRWNMKTVSKTVGEIITCCKLTSDEMVEMLNRYIRDDDVYEMGRGIYGKVLDGVWQYIRASPDKEDMCRILKHELRDNIGMCAQGNLTRLCNVLSGYMDGIGPQESVSERLGRELPLLLEVVDVTERMTRAKALLREVALPETEWVPWLEALA